MAKPSAAMSVGYSMECDVLVITALQKERDGALAETDGHKTEWVEATAQSGFPYHYCEFTDDAGEPLIVAVAWAGAMGGVAAADRCRSLVELLHPSCVAMTGICAGRRGDVFLGDVIVANRVFHYDHGKSVTTNTDTGARETQLFHEIETYNLESTWAMNAADFAVDVSSLGDLLADRPVSLDSQRMWLLRTLLAQEAEGGDPAESHAEQGARCPRWSEVVTSLERRDHVTLKAGVLKLSRDGRELALRDRVLNKTGAVPDPAFRVHVGPIAAGTNVIQDAEIFNQLKKIQRKVLGLEMESAAIGYVAANAGIPAIIVKAVADYADGDKDDSFHEFASRASFAFLIAFLKKHPPGSLRSTGATPRPVPAAAVSARHANKLRNAAKDWAEQYESTIEPGWATRPQNVDFYDSDKDLTALRQHFEKLNDDYLRWRGLNSAVRDVPTLPYAMIGGSGDKPQTPDGEALVRERNEVVRGIVFQLMKIHTQSSITGECESCRTKNRTVVRQKQQGGAGSQNWQAGRDIRFHGGSGERRN
ncbi:hypothetical protein [Mycolicibacterium gadium]|uniref:5'-methylthioadenosine/S-adenosylhomocysteine nucleosidase family protein n=1 Tax=Mycolicibacterium gadium TaxID=1794 RepID=UPI002FDDA5D9